MGKVNSDVQEIADSTLYGVQAFIDLWAMIPIEVKMYLAVMYAVSAMLQYYKKSRLMGKAKTVRKKKLATAALPLAILLSVGAAYIYHGKMHYGWFIFAGLTASRSVMWVHLFVVDIAWPFIKNLPKMRLTVKNGDGNG